jgi:diguanylate cyclase (GGDEF)-like protein
VGIIVQLRSSEGKVKMPVQAIIPLIAAVAYIPLFVALGLSRPWRRQHVLLLSVMVTSTIWSAVTFVLRSDFITGYGIQLFRVSLCIGVLYIVQLYWFLRHTIGEPGGIGLWLGYGALFILCTGATLGYVPQSIHFNQSVVTPSFGPWIFVFAVPMLALPALFLYPAISKFKASTVPEERNLLAYLFVTTGFFFIAGIFTFTPFGSKYPVAHLGNLFVAAILLYLSVRHRLTSMEFVARKVLVWSALVVVGIVVYVSLFLFIYLPVGAVIDTRLLILTTLAAMIAAVAVYVLRDVLSRTADRLFYRARYHYYQKLYDFLDQRLSGIPSLKELSEELLPLVSGALGCEKVYLFLPDQATGDFIVEFSPTRSNPGSMLIIKMDNPILAWLKRENKYISKETMDIFPEFRSLLSTERSGLKAMEIELIFPVASRGNLIGLLAFGNRKTGRYSLEDIHLVEMVTSQVAASLEKEYLQEQLRKREKELSVVNHLSNVITASLNIKDVYGVFISELKQVVEVNWATIALVEGDDLRFQVLSSEVGSTWQAGEKIPLQGTGTEWVAKHRKALYEPDLTKNTRFKTGGEHLRWGIRSVVYLPLLVKNEAIGSLVIASRQPDAYNPGQVRLLERLASQIAVSVENSLLYTRAEQRARIDELTGLFNRRHFDESVKQEIDRHARYRSMMSLILMDLDFFKAYNDTQGHTAGDRALELVGRLISRTLRNTDLAFRYGGDEFAIILPQSATNDALLVAERVRGRIASEMTIRDIKISASLGMASWPNDGVTPDELVNAADKALYYAKEMGGNRTSVASKMMPSLAQNEAASPTTDREVLSTIHALAATIEARDPYIYGHSRKVSRYAVALAEAAGLPSEKVTIINTAAMLHDIGKIGVPDEVLNKTEKLDNESWKLIQAHPALSTTIVGHVASLVASLPAILHHHERWDGLGYPDGLKGDDIPVEARVLAIADAFDAMTSNRPYRSKLSYKKVLQELKQCSGSQFDPGLIETFLPIALSVAPEDMEPEKNKSGSRANRRR